MRARLVDRLRAQLIRDEGLRLFPYQDTTGHLSIGIGRNLSQKGISLSEAEILLDNDIRHSIEQLQRILPWTFDLDDARRGVFLNLIFNMGSEGLLTFIRMLGAAQEGDWPRAAAELLDSDYAGQVGARATRLARQLETGQWQ